MTEIKPKLNLLVHSIAEKTEFTAVASSPPLSSCKTISASPSVHLKKVDPPNFSGNEIDFPEFQRKWKAIVQPANLPEEAELDRLRDSLTKDIRDMLTGIKTLNKAWQILEKRFGDKELIATSLKNQLKNLNIKEKLDHDRVIALTIKIRSIVNHLESLNASNALLYDGEFVSVVYFQLPDRQKSRWLEFDKSSFTDKWTALMSFLEATYENAVQEKLLLASYTAPSNAPKKSTTVGALATEIEEQDDSKLERVQNRLEACKQKIGKCPACNGEHTYKSKWSKTPWPSDRLVVCRKYNDMNHRQRAELLEKVAGCARCTSWKHCKKDCKVPMVDCKDLVCGSKCGQDQSNLVCNSGVIHCRTAHTSSQVDFDDINVD